MVGKLWALVQLWAVQHIVLGRATLTVVGRVVSSNIVWYLSARKIFYLS